MGMTKQATKFTCDAKIATVGLLRVGLLSHIAQPHRPSLQLIALGLIFELLKRITLSRSMGALVLILARAFATELELAFSAWFAAATAEPLAAEEAFRCRRRT